MTPGERIVSEDQVKLNMLVSTKMFEQNNTNTGRVVARGCDYYVENRTVGIIGCVDDLIETGLYVGDPY